MFLLDATVGIYPGLGPITSRKVQGIVQGKAPTPFEEAVGKNADHAENQALIALQLYLVSGGLTLPEIAKQAKTPAKSKPSAQAQEALAKLNLLLTSGKETDTAYSGPADINVQKGTVTIGKNTLENDTKETLAQHKAEIATQKKTDPERTIITEASAKVHNSLALYYSGIFQAKTSGERAKAAAKNLDSAIKAIGSKEVQKVINTKGKSIDPDLQKSLIVTLGIIQALVDKSGAPITQQALLAQLKQAVEKDQPSAVEKYKTQLITQAEQAANSIKDKATPSSLQQKPPQKTDAEKQVQMAA